MNPDEKNSSIREAAVAGYFYPDNVAEIRNMISTYMDQATPSTHENVRAIIAPHAGYVYSGAIAANAYIHLQAIKDKIKRIVLLGPAHRVYVKGMALSTADYFQTPLGRVPVDKKMQQQALLLEDVIEFDQTHAKEHSLEVHIPFLQSILDDFSLLPVVVGDADMNSVAGLIEHFWQDEETFVIVSSDLSHFHDYETACKIDQATSHAIETFETGVIGPQQACGCYPLNGLLTLAKQQSLSVQTLDLRNSGDTAGSKDRVVGYGAYAII